MATTPNPTPTTGLQISPARQELHVDPGTTVDGDLVVANLTKQDLVITLFFREFTVTNANYDYAFQLSHYDWIRIKQPEVTLKPGESRTIPYSLSPTADASPGGYYFTIFASSNLQSGGINSTIQAASLQYVTVNGRLDKSTRLDKITLPNVLASPDITYGFDMTNTGNVYYTIYSTARLSNVFATTEGETAAHIVLPQKPRTMTGTLPAPPYPGIYTATIGYRTDSGNFMTLSKPVLYLPLWGVVIGIGIVIVLLRVGVVVFKRWRRRKQMR